MKKAFALFLSALLILCAVSCSGQNDVNETSKEASSPAVESKAAESIPEAVSEVSEQISEPVSEESDEEVSEPISEEISEPASEEISEPVSEEVSEPVSEEISEPVSEEISEPVSEEISEPVSEEVSEPEPPVEKEYFDFLAEASTSSVDNRVTGGSVAVFTNNDSIQSGNLRWSCNIVLDKTDIPYVFSVVKCYVGNGGDPTFLLEDGQICLAVHYDDSREINKAGVVKAKALAKGDLIAIVGIEENDLQVIKEYEEGEKLEYVQPVTQ